MPLIAMLTLHSTVAGNCRHSKMTTRLTTVTTTRERSRRRSLFRLCIAAFAAVLTLTVAELSHLRAQTAPLQIIPQAQGQSTGKDVNRHGSSRATRYRPCVETHS